MRKSAEFILMILAGFFVSCTHLVENEQKQKISGEFGAIYVNNASRAVETDSIKFAKVTVTGNGIEKAIEKEASVSGGTGSFLIENIPAGPNRIVTVYALDESKAVMNDIVIRNVCDVAAGETTECSVNWATTALGNVFNLLKNDGINISECSKAEIEAVIDSSVHSSFINVSSIAEDYKNKSLKTKAEYVNEASSLELNFNYDKEFKVQVCDPSSSVVVGKNGKTTVQNIAPGTWKILLLDSENKLIKDSTLNLFTSGNVTILNLIEDDNEEKTGIKVHAKYTHLWAWNKNGESGNLFETWPGILMAEETNGWYGYEIKDASSCSLIFSNNGSDKTSDLEITESGEYWYNGGWTNSNPDKPVTPVVRSSVEEGLYNKTILIELSSTNKSGDIIYWTIDGSEPDTNSNVYSQAIKLEAKNSRTEIVLKAFAVNPLADISTGNVSTFTFIIDPSADLEPPVIKPSVNPGRLSVAAEISFVIEDDSDCEVYYTEDGSTPSESSSKLTAGKKFNIIQEGDKLNIRILAVDAEGNSSTGAYYYYWGKKTDATRWDPRQESIYFLLTSRWFDGDESNSIGDENCSWTEARANDNIPASEDGFTGPEDVTWRGDFKGLVEKMDYIKALGFTCIWITPVVQNRSPLCYHGYHAWDMYKEDARLVSEGYDFQRVIDEAHARDMKICLDIVINHSGRFGLKDFAEIKYNRGNSCFVTPKGWESFSYDESEYLKAYSLTNKLGVLTGSQNFPNGWEYDGLKSPGLYPDGYVITNNAGWTKDVGGTPIPGYVPFNKDCRPFTQADVAAYSVLSDSTKYCWPSSESYCLTIDGLDEKGSLTYSGYEQSSRRIRGHNTGFPTGSGSFDNYPDATLDSLHEDCPDLNIENPEVQNYIIGAYNRYIDMGVDMFRVDTVMHMRKETLNNVYWPAFMEHAASQGAKDARGGSDFFIFGEVANFVNNLSDKPAELRQSNYVWDNTVTGPLGSASSNHELNGNEYRTISKKDHKAVPESDYVVSVIDIISHNGFCDGVQGAYNRALSNSSAYWDSTYLTWYTDSHDYGPNKGETRWQGDFASAWSMLFTFRGIPIVYYGSEIRFAAGKPNDWPGGGGNGVNMSLEKTGRSYYGNHLEGEVTATDFGEYSASGEIASTLSSDLSKHLRDLNKMRIAIPALQMGQYSTEGHNGGWAGYKRRYTGKNKITGEAVDSYVLVGVGSGTHSWTGALDGTYIDAVTGKTAVCSGGKISMTVNGDSGAALGVYVHTGLATKAPGKVCSESPYFAN